MKRVTILFLQKDDQVLLAMKKRGFGVGKWNGVGGKVEDGETAAQAAVRECQEEIGVTPHTPKLVAKLDFFDQADPGFHHQASVFTSKSWDGDPHETEEMRPQWFAQAAVPYTDMWAADRLWIPEVLAGALLTGRITFNGEKLVQHSFTPVHRIDE
ncbi:MAG TPA: 8-oxo-dGTP diphosphatase [Candidatus Saccharimonadales bacterium]|nr:8-oxo-dGTP diphosphatase [Candidatus Saccharimonadales bacterium]